MNFFATIPCAHSYLMRIGLVARADVTYGLSLDIATAWTGLSTRLDNGHLRN